MPIEKFSLLLIESLSDPSVVENLLSVTKPNQARIADLVEARMNETMKKLKDEMASKDEEIERLRKRVAELEGKSDDQEQYSRRTSIRISGIPEKKDENILSVVNNLFEEMDVHPIINRVHRVGTRSDDATKHRQVICQFITHPDKVLVMKNKKKIKGTRSNVFINEDLTRLRAKIFYQAREKKREKLIEDCWTADGRICVKDLKNKIHYITKLSELGKFNVLMFLMSHIIDLCSPYFLSYSFIMFLFLIVFSFFFVQSIFSVFTLFFPLMYLHSLDSMISNFFFISITLGLYYINYSIFIPKLGPRDNYVLSKYGFI